ncbi:biotin transporter BioY [Salsuginibacillus kocurii]|uniref:biotin transporter BioY n=1 Tax=Salsuginibacillus kocurii TaxID=427078 RepID=UPI000686DC37
MINKDIIGGDDLRLRPLEMMLAATFAALMAVGGNITMIAPFLVVGDVPITFQPFVAILAGAVLGSRLGALSMVIYALVGLTGVPVFAQFSGGLGSIVSPTFGFIISFIIMAYVVGKIIELRPGPSYGTYLLAAFSGLAINYLVGTNLMYFSYMFVAEAPEGFSYPYVWIIMAAPFVKDVVFTALAASTAPKLARMVKQPNHRTGSSQPKAS